MNDGPSTNRLGQISLQNQNQTADLAAKIGKWLLNDPLGVGATIGLCGTLGAGKTYFAKSLIASLGIDRNQITSPTFSLIQTYPIISNSGQWMIHHLDAYRLRDEVEFLELGVEELFEARQAIVLVEWAKKVKFVLPIKTLWLDFEWSSETERLLTFYGVDEWRECMYEVFG